MKKYYDIWLSVVCGVSCPNGGRIARLDITAEEIYNNRADLSAYEAFSEKQAEKARNTHLYDIKDIYNAHIKAGINSVNCFDREYPERFKNIFNRPVVLFYKGDLSLLNSSCTVGVVGSRHCSGEGESACRTIAKDIALMGGVVVSGLAQGIDTTAHKACVEAGGKTVAFTGVPLDEYYPKTNRAFQKKLAEEHLVVSEYHSGFEYFSANFIHRNRLIAAASDGLCVIQAKKRSGSLATVNRAIEYDRPVFTVPGSIFDSGYEGSNMLLAENKAQAVINGVQLMAFLGVEVKATSRKKKLPPVSDSAKQVLAVITKPMFTSAVVKAAGLPAGIVRAAITELEVAGYIKQTASGEYVAGNR